jgi:PAS domain S-box-containing protein
VWGPTVDTSARVQRALEALPTPIVITDRAGTIVFVNHSLERQFAYAAEDMLGRDIDLLVPQAHPLIDQAAGANASLTMPPEAGRALIGRRKDGSTFAAELVLNPMDTSGEQFVLACVVDVEERRRLERERTAAIETQLAFERSVAQLSYQFINLPADETNDAIRSGLGRMCEQLGVDRGAFLTFGPGGR